MRWKKKRALEMLKEGYTIREITLGAPYPQGLLRELMKQQGIARGRSGRRGNKGIASLHE